MRKSPWLPILLSLLSLVISIVALCNVLPTHGVDMDYQGVLVGILSLLVTLLIGWNIYTAMDLKSKVDHLTRHNERLNNQTRTFQQDIGQKMSTMREEYKEQLRRSKHYTTGFSFFLQGFSNSTVNPHHHYSTYCDYISSLYHRQLDGVSTTQNMETCIINMEVTYNNRMSDEAPIDDWDRYSTGLSHQINQIINSTNERFTPELKERFIAIKSKWEQLRPSGEDS